MRKVLITIVLALAIIQLQPTIVAAGQTPSLQLKVMPGSGVLRASTKLSSQFWRDGSGQATVEIEAIAGEERFPEAVAAAYRIHEQLLSMDIPYHRPSPKEMKINIRITGIQDRNGSNSVIFQGSCSLPARKTLSSTGTPGTNENKQQPASQTAILNTDGYSKPPARTETAATPGAQGGDSKETTNTATLSLFWKCLAALNFVLIFVAVWYLRRQRPASASPVDPPDYPELKRDVDSAKQSLQDLKRTIREQSRPDFPSPKHPQPTVDPWGTTEDINRLVEVALARSTPAPTSNTGFERPFGSTPDKADAKTAAAVNGWLAGQNCSRRELVQHAKALGLNSWMASMRNPNDWRLEMFEYMFEMNEDGAWLLTPITGGSEIWLAPADASLLGMGKAPSILKSLFEGMENAGQGFRFEAIYRPCRLRCVTGKSDVYTLVNKGILQLAGDPPPAGMGMPPRLQPGNPSKSSQNSQQQLWITPSLPDGKRPPIARLLADWMSSISTQLREQSSKLERPRNEQRQATPSMLQAGVDTEALRELSGKLATLRSNFTRQSEDIDAMRNDIKAWPEKVRCEIKRAVNELRDESKPQPQLESAPQRAPLAAAPDSVPVSEHTAERNSGLIETPDDIPKPTPSLEGTMPTQWKQAWQEAAQDPASQPDFLEIPRPDLYASRLLNLQRLLHGQDSNATVSVVHLCIIRMPEGELFELHETGPGRDDDGLLRCKRCNTSSVWQFAVSVEVRRNLQMNILYPMGQYGKSNFSSGYEILIDNPPSPSFSIMEPCFAELHCKNHQAMTFEAKRQISCARRIMLTEGRP